MCSSSGPRSHFFECPGFCREKAARGFSSFEGSCQVGRGVLLLLLLLLPPQKSSDARKKIWETDITPTSSSLQES